MRNATHGLMFAQYEEDASKDEKVTGRCFESTGADKSPMTSTVCTYIESFNLP